MKKFLFSVNVYVFITMMLFMFKMGLHACVFFPMMLIYC